MNHPDAIDTAVTLLTEDLSTDFASLASKIRATLPKVTALQNRLLGTLAAGEAGRVKLLLKNVEAALEGGAAEFAYPQESTAHAAALCEDIVSSLAGTPEEDLEYARNILDDINDAIGDITYAVVSKTAKLTKKVWRHGEPVALAAVPILHEIAEILRTLGDGLDMAIKHTL